MKKSLISFSGWLLMLALFSACAQAEQKKSEVTEESKEEPKTSNEKTNTDNPAAKNEDNIESPCMKGKSEDFLSFFAFVEKEYYKPLMLLGEGQNLFDFNLTGRTGLIIKVWGHALSYQLKYMKKGTPQHERWKKLEKESESFFTCATEEYWDNNKATMAASKKDYMSLSLRYYREALLGAYDDEVEELAGTARTAIPSFFGKTEDPANKAVPPSEYEEKLLGDWKNTSMKFGSTVVELIPNSNFIKLRNDHQYEYVAHTKGANLVETRGNWRYYRNGSKHYLALEHTMQKKSGQFVAVAKRRESVFLIREISSAKMILYEEKDDPDWSVTLVYEQ